MLEAEDLGRDVLRPPQPDAPPRRALQPAQQRRARRRASRCCTSRASRRAPSSRCARRATTSASTTRASSGRSRPRCSCRARRTRRRAGRRRRRRRAVARHRVRRTLPTGRAPPPRRRSSTRPRRGRRPPGCPCASCRSPGRTRARPSFRLVLGRKRSICGDEGRLDVVDLRPAVGVERPRPPCKACEGRHVAHTCGKPRGKRGKRGRKKILNWRSGKRPASLISSKGETLARIRGGVSSTGVPRQWPPPRAARLRPHRRTRQHRSDRGGGGGGSSAPARRRARRRRPRHAPVVCTSRGRISTAGAGCGAPALL